MDIGGKVNMAVMIESLIGILLFTVLIVSLTLKNPLTSVGDYPPVIREKCMELGLIENQGRYPPKGDRPACFCVHLRCCPETV